MDVHHVKAQLGQHLLDRAGNVDRQRGGSPPGGRERKHLADTKYHRGALRSVEQRVALIADRAPALADELRRL